MIPLGSDEFEPPNDTRPQVARGRDPAAIWALLVHGKAERMKRGVLKKVVDTYAGLLEAPWKHIRNDILRCEGDWVRFLTFNPSRWDDVYEPRSCLEFLKIPGDPTGGFVLSPLQNSNGSQRWVHAAGLSGPSSKDSASTVFAEMVRQFRPHILQPLDPKEIVSLLTADLGYWPNPYALCVMAAEAGNAADAERYFRAFLSATADKPYPWAEDHKLELARCLNEIGSPGLRARLAEIRLEKLRLLRMLP